jgi:hypothetical protein
VHILEMTKRIHINVLLTVCTALVGFGYPDDCHFAGVLHEPARCRHDGDQGRRCLSHLVPSVRTSMTPNALGRRPLRQVEPPGTKRGGA